MFEFIFYIFKISKRLNKIETQFNDISIGQANAKKASKATIKFLKSVVEEKYHENIIQGQLITENMFDVKLDNLKVNLSQTDLSSYKKYFDDDGNISLKNIQHQQISNSALTNTSSTQ